MRRPPPIRITKNDREEYAKLVRNAKAKVRRTAEKYGVDISSKVNLPKLEDIKTREEFNRIKQEAKRVTNRANTEFQFVKNPFGVVASKKEIREIERNTKKAQRIAEQKLKEIEKKPFISGGKEQGTVGQRMKQMAKPETMTGINVPKDFNFDKIRDRKQLERKREGLERRIDENYYDKKMEQMKENFVRILELSLHNDADVLVEELKKMPADDFYEMYLMFDEFDFALWDSDGIIFGREEEAMNHVSKMLTYVERYKEGKINMDMKGF